MQAVEAYRRELATALDGKDPRTTGAKLGSVVLSFMGEGVITVQVLKDRVSVVDGGHSLEGKPVALVRARLVDWLRYCEAPANGEHGIEVFGDEEMLSTLGVLVDKKRSPLAARFFR